MSNEGTRPTLVLALPPLLGLIGCVEAQDRAPGPEVHTRRDAPPAVVSVKVCPDGTGSYTTIQSAVSAVDSGSTLRLCEATFRENVVISGKTLYLRSIGEGADTVIDGGGAGTALSLSSGAVVSVVDITLTNGLVSGPGGGISCNASTLTLDTAVVTGNQAVRGGGLFSQGCALTIKYSTITDNVATSMGGGADLENSTGRVRESEISENSAPEGGGLYVWGGTVTIQSNDILNNEATTTDETLHGEGGGGAGLFVYGAVPIKDNVIEGNEAAYNGGGMYLYYASAIVSNNTVTDNEAGRDGGGVYMNYATSTISGNTVTYNSAGDDGGGLRAYRGTSTIEDNTFSYNSAGDDGGGVKLSHTERLLTDNTITENSAVDGGGGVELDDDVTPIVGCIISGNTAANGAGLRIIKPWAAVELDDLTIEDNVATTTGGGVSLDTAAYGGALTHLIIRSNRAPLGGGLYATASDLDLSNSVLNGNSATTSGGGIYLTSVSGSVDNVVVASNTGASGAGAGLTLTDASGLSVRNTAVTSNNRGAGVLVSGTGVGSWTYNDVHDHSSNYSGMTDPTGSDGNISVGARYTSASTYDFTLQSTSRLINAGDPAVLDPDGSRSDIGAYGGAGGTWD